MNEVDRTVLARLRALLGERVPLYKLFLFGSRARGDADLDSDMDVLVVVDGEFAWDTQEAVSHCAWEAGFEHHVVVTTVVVGRDDWERGPSHYSLLAQAVREEGISV